MDLPGAVPKGIAAEVVKSVTGEDLHRNPETPFRTSGSSGSRARRTWTTSSVPSTTRNAITAAMDPQEDPRLATSARAILSRLLPSTHVTTRQIHW